MSENIKNGVTEKSSRVENNKEEKVMEILKDHENPCLIMDRPMTDAELARFVQMIEKDYMVTAPKHLKENILKERKNIGVQMVRQSNMLSTKMQLFLYGLKISAAVAGAIFMISVININSAMEAPRVNVPQKEQTVSSTEVSKILNEKSNAVSSALNDFSNNLLNWR